MKNIEVGTILVGKKESNLIINNQVLVRVDSVEDDRVNITIVGCENPKHKGMIGAVASGLSIDYFDVASEEDFERIAY